ncbi:MAG: hypothetical protein J5687_07285 [Treponema sp.]|nr:hypothetical protein [Treponema sp.]
MKHKFRLLKIIIVFLITTPVFAQSQDAIELDDNNGEVMSLFEIERLIRKTDYTEALKQLNLYIEKKPDYFDNAQRLVKIIMNRRKQYSVLAEKAIRSSEQNPEDHETPAKIILQMRSIEKNPPAEIKRMIDLLEDMHLFKYYAYLYDKLLEDSSELSHKGSYFEAIAKVRDEGFDIYKDEYYDSYEFENTQMVTDAEAIMTALNDAILRFEDTSLQKEFDTINTQFLKAINDDDFEQAERLLPQLQAAYTKYSQIRNDVYDCGQNIIALYAKQRELDSEITDASYLPFMQRFILGASEPADSGILGAIDCKFNTSLEKIKSAIIVAEESRTNRYLAVLPEKLLESNADYYELTNRTKYAYPLEKYAALGKQTNALYGLLKIAPAEDGTEQVHAPHPEYDIVVDYEPKLALLTVALLEKAKDFEAEQNVQKQLLSTTTTDITPLFDSVFRMTTILGVKSTLVPEAYEWGSAYLALEDTSLWAASTELYNSYLNTLFDSSAASMTDSWTIITESYKADSDSYVATAGEYKTYAQTYSTGFDEHVDLNSMGGSSATAEQLLSYAKNSGAQTNPVYHYPDLSIKLYQKSQELSAEYIGAIEERQSSLTQNLNAHEDWLANEELVQVVNSAVDYLQNRKSELELNRMQSTQELAEAQVELEEAAYAKNNAASIFDEAQDALARGNLASAEKLLLEASERYADSLEIADDAALRAQVDSSVAKLSTQIMDAKNELVVKESRELYTQAREALNYDRYEDAETSINAAINKWAETHTEKNPEFETFLELVNTAVSMKTGRVLLGSDPLYSEMSQLLSIAYQYYDEGEQYIKQGKDKEADEALTLAEESLNKIKAVYPLNQEASLLLLKIDRLHDPKKFEEEFAQKVQTAIAQSKNKDTMAQAYNTLTDYYNLEPNYKGLKDAIYNLEIELGMRQRPVDNSAAARSTRLTTQAQSQFNSAGSNTAKLNQALETVNEALRLNPNNKTAEALKDRISLKIGSSSIIVLSSDDQNLLTQAKKAYQSGNIDAANTYMLRLLNNNPNNIKLKEVEDLNNKIKSQL